MVDDLTGFFAAGLRVGVVAFAAGLVVVAGFGASVAAGVAAVDGAGPLTTSAVFVAVPVTVPRSVCSSALAASFQVPDTRPFESLTAFAGVTVPDCAARLSRAPDTGLP